MRVKKYMAQTVNGKIARKTGEEDFLSARNWQEFRKIAESAGVFAVGRKTYNAVKGWEEKGFKDIEAERIILSRNEELQLEDGFKKVSCPEKAIKIAENDGFEELLVTGGAEVNSSFMEKGLFDEIILNIEPYVLGEGIDLFAESSFEERLELEEVLQLEEGIFQLRYSL